MDIGKLLDFLGTVGSLNTTVCLNTGSGANAINSSFLQSKIFEVIKEHSFQNPIQMEVGNSNEITITKAVLTKIEAKNNEALIWWLVSSTLPLPALIGRPTAERLNLTHNVTHGKASWNGTLLENALTSQGMHCHKPMQPEEKELSPPKPVYTTKVVRIPPRSMKEVEIQMKGCNGPQAFFMPRFIQKGKLMSPPRLISFDSQQSGKATIMIMNPTVTNIKLKSGSHVDTVYIMNKDDVDQTILIELSERPMTEVGTLNKGPDIKKQNEKKETPLKMPNVKVGMNYLSALPSHLFKEEEDKSVQPIPFIKLLTENPTPEFMKGYLHGIPKPKVEPEINDVISLLCQRPINKKNSQEDIPPDLKEVMDTFKLQEADLKHE